MSNKKLYFDGSTEEFWQLCSVETCRYVEACHCNVDQKSVEIFSWCDKGALHIRNIGDNFRSIILKIIYLFK
jgi:hypothetical protein